MGFVGGGDESLERRIREDGFLIAVKCETDFTVPDITAYGMIVFSRPEAFARYLEIDLAALLEEQSEIIAEMEITPPVGVVYVRELGFFDTRKPEIKLAGYIHYNDTQKPITAHSELGAFQAVRTQLLKYAIEVAQKNKLSDLVVLSRPVLRETMVPYYIQIQTTPDPIPSISMQDLLREQYVKPLLQLRHDPSFHTETGREQYRALARKLVGDVAEYNGQRTAQRILRQIEQLPLQTTEPLPPLLQNSLAELEALACGDYDRVIDLHNERRALGEEQ
jgi:hypothetical protein